MQATLDPGVKPKTRMPKKTMSLMKQLREMAGVSQPEIAEAIGGRKTTVSNWDRQTAAPHLAPEQVVILANKYKQVDLEALATACEDNHLQMQLDSGATELDPTLPPLQINLAYYHYFALASGLTYREFLESLQEVMKNRAVRVKRKWKRETKA